MVDPTDISNKDSYYVGKPGEDNAEKGYPPGHLDRSSLRRLSVVRAPEDCDEDGHIRRTGACQATVPLLPQQAPKKLS